MLEETTAAQVVANMTPELLAQGMGATTFTPPRAADDPECWRSRRRSRTATAWR